MKKIFILSLSSFLFFSCKKTFTCDCNVTLPESSTNAKHTINNARKKNAIIECQNIEYNFDQEYRLKGGSYICDLR